MVFAITDTQHENAIKMAWTEILMIASCSSRFKKKINDTFSLPLHPIQFTTKNLDAPEYIVVHGVEAFERIQLISCGGQLDLMHPHPSSIIRANSATISTYL